MTEIEVGDLEQVRALPVGEYRVVRGNADVHVLPLGYQESRRSGLTAVVVLLRYPVVLTPLFEQSGGNPQ